MRPTSLSAECLIDPQRLVAPREHLGVLIEPNAAAIRACVARHAARAFDAVGVLDTTLGALRARLRSRLQLDAPVIMTGHQAEFFHAGVFAKTIAADALAAQLGGAAVFLTVDSDVPKAQQLALPDTTGDRLRRVFVPIPGCDPQLPAEWQPRVPAEQWREFFDRLRASGGVSGGSVLDTFTRGWFASDSPTLDFCDGIVRGHAATEKALGLGGSRDLRTSRLCALPEFRALVAHLALHAASFATHYNDAQAAYRRRYRVRNAQRPAPMLDTGGGRVELPFWIYRAGRPRRRLHVADRTDAVLFFADDEQIGVLSKADLRRAAYHETPWPLEAAGWHVRLRALTLSAFARLLVADLFIHGIGGAKYDRMTEDFVQRFFGVEPVPTCCVSATVHLPLAREGFSLDDVRAARRQVRDVRFNPQRYLREAPRELLRRRADLIRRSAALKAREPHAHAARREVFTEIRRANAELLRCAPGLADELAQRVEQLEEALRQDRVARDREYFFALHRGSDLDELVRNVRGLLE